MRLLFQRARYYYFYGLFSTLFLLMYPRSKRLLQAGKYREAHRWRTLWAYKLCRLVGYRLDIQTEEPIDFSQTYIVCANHASYLDIPAMCAALPLYFGFMGKADADELPFIKTFYETIDIAVVREDATRSIATFKKAMQALKEGRSLVIFPEGGIFPDPLKVKPFKEGAFQLAQRMQVPILTVGLPDNYKLLPDEIKIAKTGRIRIILHKPIYPEGKTAAELSEEVRSLLQEDIIRYANED